MDERVDLFVAFFDHPLYPVFAHYDTTDALHHDWLDARDAFDLHGMWCADVLLKRSSKAAIAIERVIEDDLLRNR